jgi:hypothetical protein
MYLWSRQWGIQPSEFWDMTISEWWIEYELRAPVGEDKFAGKLTRSDVDDLKAWMEEKNGADRRASG